VASEIAAKTGSCGARLFLFKEQTMTNAELRQKLRNFPVGLFGRPASA
jgi:hypothetical protein